MNINSRILCVKLLTRHHVNINIHLISVGSSRFKWKDVEGWVMMVSVDQGRCIENPVVVNVCDKIQTKHFDGKISVELNGVKIKNCCSV
jgi:hypothetical protein